MALLVGLVVVLAASAMVSKISGGSHSAQCPAGWQSASVVPSPGNKQVLACSNDGAELSLEWSVRGSGRVPSEIAASAAPELEPPFERWVKSTDSEGPKLLADVYFLSAGRRYGLLSIVHGPEARLTQDDQLAPWLETIEGTAPWGSPQESDLRASCPAGFQTMPNSMPRMVVRCLNAMGTTRFTVLQLLWSEGGFGSAEDRTRLAGDIAQRVASSSGSAARVLEQPTVYTRARNVDAMRAKFETDEKLTLTAIDQWTRTPTSGNLALRYRGPSDPARIAAAERLLQSMSYTRVGFSATLLIVGLGVAWSLLVALWAVKKLRKARTQVTL